MKYPSHCVFSSVVPIVFVPVVLGVFLAFEFVLVLVLVLCSVCVACFPPIDVTTKMVLAMLLTTITANITVRNCGMTFRTF